MGTLGTARFLFNQETLSYANQVGYAHKISLYEALAQGDYDHARASLRLILQHLRTLLCANPDHPLEMYREMIRYSWIQVSAVSEKAGISTQEVNNTVAPYFYALDETGDLDGVDQLYYQLLEELSLKIQKNRECHIFSALVSACCQYVQEHLYDDLSVQQIAQQMFFSQNYISRRFKDETGITLKKYILRERIQEGKRLLRETDLPIGVIGQKLLFVSQSHFTEVFRRQTGMTPLHYRKHTT